MFHRTVYEIDNIIIFRECDEVYDNQIRDAEIFS